MEYVATPESSNISQIGYDRDTSVLEVEFNNGGTYLYYDVPESVWEEFKGADSKGQFLHQQIKGMYRYSKA